MLSAKHGRLGVEPLEAKLWIEIIAAAAIPVAVAGAVLERVTIKRGIGVRTIQFIGISTISPLVLILGLEGILEKSAIAALLGALAGYLFSNIGQYDKREDDSQDA